MSAAKKSAVIILSPIWVPVVMSIAVSMFAMGGCVAGTLLCYSLGRDVFND